MTKSTVQGAREILVLAPGITYWAALACCAANAEKMRRVVDGVGRTSWSRAFDAVMPPLWDIVAGRVSIMDARAVKNYVTPETSVWEPEEMFWYAMEAAGTLEIAADAARTGARRGTRWHFCDSVMKLAEVTLGAEEFLQGSGLPLNDLWEKEVQSQAAIFELLRNRRNPDPDVVERVREVALESAKLHRAAADLICQAQRES